ncbi:hypothetical protein [Branchiibius cervicis]|uniref:Uncharacterized protein n=1 Tax=Branchiibius cervicis TaxID=908252 RepID=A0ABW2AVK0_9MICO
MSSANPPSLRRLTAAVRRVEERTAALADATAERDTLIRALAATGVTNAELASTSGLTRGRISQIIKGGR